VSPNDITYDPLSKSLWLVDNNGGYVLKMSPQGACLGGFTIPLAVLNPVGIAFDRNTNTLFVSHQGAVMQLGLTGTLLTGGFSFTPTPGSNILSGITYVPATDHFLVTQSSGNRVFEVDRTGALISTTSLATFGIVNTQGLHYNPLLQQLVVIDNSLSTTFVFDLPFCTGIVAHRGIGCTDGGGATLVMGATGCANIGGVVNLQALATPSPFGMLIAGGVSDTFAGPVPLPFDLGLIGGPFGCLVYTSTDVLITVGMVGSTATLPFGIPANPALAGSRVFFQALKLDPLLPVGLPLASSNYVELVVY
jgi:DNA-binding beta-propeller fold protein YncE